MKKGNLALSCIVLATLAACDSDSKTDDDILADGGYVLEYQLDGETFEVRQDNVGQFEIACPIGVECGADYAYRAHMFADENFIIYMSFSPDLVNNYSYDNIVSNFNYADLRIQVPSLGTENSEVYFQPRDVLRELSFNADIVRTSSFRLDLHSYEDGYLSGTWTGTITELTERTEDLSDDDCVADDILGECYAPISVNMPFILQFNLEIEQ